MRIGECETCGKSFSYSTPGRPALTCSDECRTAREKVRGRVRRERWARRTVARMLSDDGLPPGWEVGRPSRYDHPVRWEQVAWDTTERPRPGKPRSRTWTAVAPTEEAVLTEMARCLAEVREGRVPQ